MKLGYLFLLVITAITIGCAKQDESPVPETPAMQMYEVEYGANGFQLKNEADQALVEPSIRQALSIDYENHGGGGGKKNEKAPILQLAEKAVRDLENPAQVSFTGIGLGSMTDAGAKKCTFLKVAWRQNYGDPQMQKLYFPEDQSPDCHKSVIKKGSTKGLAGGYVITAAKILSGTYAGAIGAGLVGVGFNSLGACGIGAMGIFSSEFSYAAGIFGGTCGYLKF